MTFNLVLLLATNPPPNPWLECLNIFQELAPGVAALLIAFATLRGVGQYSIAAKAEVRARRSAEVETETKIAQQFTSLMRTAEGFSEEGPTVIGLASQRSAILSVVRLVRLHRTLKDAALEGLKTLQGTGNMDRVKAQLGRAVADIEALPNAPIDRER